MCETRKEIYERKRDGKKELIWSLNSKQKHFIEELGFATEAYLYEVNTITFYNVKSLNGLLKQIHFSKKRGKNVIVIKLNSKQKKILDEFNVKYKPYKYKIKLCS